MKSVWRAIGCCALMVWLSACTSTGTLPGTVSTDNSQKIEDVLFESAETSVAIVEGSVPPPEVTDALIPSLPETPSGMQEERFDISVNNLAANEFFMGIVQDTPYNLVVHPEVTGNISLDLKNVSLQQVLEVTRQMYGYDFDYANGIYKVLPAGLRTRVYQINYLNIKRAGLSDILVSSGQLSTNVSGSGGSSGGSSTSSAVLSRITTESEVDFWSALQTSLVTIIGTEEGRSVITNGSAGIVLVKALPSELEEVEEYLERSQLIMQRQVVLEAKILEVTLNEGFQQGVNWQYVKDLTSELDDDGFARRAVTLGQNSIDLANPIGGVFSAAFRINNFTAMIDLLRSQGSVQVLSSPRIATINNQKAVIKVGTDEFFVTGIETSDDNDNNEESTDVEITPFFSGIALDVTPQIGEDGMITLHVHPTVSEVEDQVKTIVVGNRSLVLPLALSTVRETDSVIKAQNGEVVVIGGLIRNVTQDEETEVPLLGDIPVIGEAFKQKRQVEQKSELVILIRPILSDSGFFSEDMLNAKKRINQLRQRIESDH